jgi:hypothetical protein
VEISAFTSALYSWSQDGCYLSRTVPIFELEEEEKQRIHAAEFPPPHSKLSQFYSINSLFEGAGAVLGLELRASQLLGRHSTA